MTTLATETLTVQELAASIAADIRQYGHFQGLVGQTMYSKHNPSGRRCLVQSSGFDKVFGRGVFGGLEKALGVDDPTYWNDSTPTEEVLAKLDEIAAS